MQTIADLLAHIPQTGRLEWIGLSAGHRAPIRAVERVIAQAGHGLVGDYHARAAGKRQVTLVQFEHLAVIEALLKRNELSAELLRRNLSVSGINLLALKGQQFTIGDVLLQGVGLCHPCMRMEQALGPGGYQAMRGHGGLIARVLRGGELYAGAAVVHVENETQQALPLSLL